LGDNSTEGGFERKALPRLPLDFERDFAVAKAGETSPGQHHRRGAFDLERGVGLAIVERDGGDPFEQLKRISLD
jgi:hypothetical protein